MFYVEGENRLYTALCMAGGFFCLAAALFFGSGLAAAAGSLLFFLSLAIWKYGYILLPYFTKGARIVEAGRNFEIPPSQDVIVGRGSSSFLATVFLSARLYESSSDKDSDGRRSYSEMFERAVSSFGFPFRLCCHVTPIDLKGELEEIRTKRSMAESRMEKLRREKSAEAARLRREIAMWSRQIERLTSGQKPLEVVFYLSTTASGLTKEEAIARARAQGEQLSVVVGGALSCEVAKLAGEDMKRCFAWDFFGPTDADDLRDQLF